jgi:para-aminobenzoate synthetase component I
MNVYRNKNHIDEIRQCFPHDDMILLESQMQGHPSSIRSFAAVRPKNWISARGNRIEQQLNDKQSSFEMNPWDALSAFRNRINGWLFGYFGYDLKNQIEEIQSQNPAIADLPDLYFMEPELLFVIDSDGFRQISGKSAKIPENLNKSLPVAINGFEADLKKEKYVENVLSIQNHIKNGDFYELNYSFPMVGKFDGNPYDLYRKMRQINPVPFGAFLTIGNFSAACVSPERFLGKKGSKIKSEPIKGTAERAEENQLDLLRKEELLNEKNRAENLMIVDLVRHDMSKIAKTGSVKVSKLYDVQTFGTVHQLISAVEAEVDENTDPVNIIKSCFPMGSMTGAPKIEVMKFIDRFEHYKRGLYSGAIGYFTPEGDFDFNVVIRTAIMQNGRLVYPVGGAITSDSIPEKEWEETEIKSRSITKVFEQDVIRT